MPANEAPPLPPLDRGIIEGEVRSPESAVNGLRDQNQRLTDEVRNTALVRVATAERHLALAAANRDSAGAAAH